MAKGIRAKGDEGNKVERSLNARGALNVRAGTGESVSKSKY